MMMFLAGSGIPTLAQLHIPLMLIRGQFLLTRQMWLFMSANLNPRPAPPQPPGKFISVQSGNIGDSNLKTVSWVESIFLNTYTVRLYGGGSGLTLEPRPPLR